LDPTAEYLDPNESADNPYRTYAMRSGKHRGKTLAQIKNNDKQYVNWIHRTHYSSLRHDHVLKEALDQWAEDGSSNKFPSLAEAPAQFKVSGNRAIYMQQRFLKKHWKITPEELVRAGVKSWDAIGSKTGAKKFAVSKRSGTNCILFEIWLTLYRDVLLWHLCLDVTRGGIMSEQEASAKADEEVDKTMQSKVQYNKFQSGYYMGG
jgi:hypothetical protein